MLRGVLLASRRAERTDDAIAAFLEATCSGFGWPIGLYFEKTATGPSLIATPIRFPKNGAQQNHVRALAERNRDDTAAVLDQELLRQRVPRWIPNVTVEPAFEAAKQAVAVGVRGLVGVPIVAGSRVYGVVEFFTKDEFNPSPDQIEFLTDLGHIVGTAVHFREVERRIGKMRREQEAVFERLRDPVYIVDRSGKATFVNESAQKLFGRSRAELVGEDIHARFHLGADGVTAVPAAECHLHGQPSRTLDGIQRRERFRTGSERSVEVEAVAAPFVLDGTEGTVIVLRLPW